MTTTAHLWAIGYDNMDRADRVLDVIKGLGWGPGIVGSSLALLDIAVVERHPDGSFTIDRVPFPGIPTSWPVPVWGISQAWSWPPRYQERPSARCLAALPPLPKLLTQ